MKITPIEIRQHTFEKKPLGGYRVDEVEAFLSSLSQEWERVTSENKMLKMQLELAEKELNKLKEIELTLFRTLKNAEDSSAQIADQANQQAEKYLTESRQKADEHIVAAKRKATVMVQDAENQTRYVRENLDAELKALEQDFKSMERYKDNLMVQIRALATSAMESVDRFEKKFAKQSAKQTFDALAAPETTTTPDEAPAAIPQGDYTPAQEPAPATEETAPEATHEDVSPVPVAQVQPASDEDDHLIDDESEPLPTTASVLAANAAAMPADADVPADLPTNASTHDEPVAMAGADASAEQTSTVSTEDSPENQHVTTEEDNSVKKGGSFFDQI